MVGNWPAKGVVLDSGALLKRCQACTGWIEQWDSVLVSRLGDLASRLGAATRVWQVPSHLPLTGHTSPLASTSPRLPDHPSRKQLCLS